MCESGKPLVAWIAKTVAARHKKEVASPKKVGPTHETQRRKELSPTWTSQETESSCLAYAQILPGSAHEALPSTHKLLTPTRPLPPGRKMALIHE